MASFQVYILILNFHLQIATMENNIQNYTSLISDEKEILLFPLFTYTTEYHEECITTNKCTKAYFIIILTVNVSWNLVPKQKEDLIELYPDLIWIENYRVQWLETAKKSCKSYSSDECHGTVKWMLLSWCE